jgi:hypothetical protein
MIVKQFFKEYWWFIAIILAFLIFVTFVLRSIQQDNIRAKETKDYCGIIIDKGSDPPSSGYKSSRDAQYWVVIIDEDIHQAIRIHVTPGCFYSEEKGKRVCFALSGREMEDYGNTNDYKHLK